MPAPQDRARSRVSVHFDPHLYRWLKVYSASEGPTLQDIVADAALQWAMARGYTPPTNTDATASDKTAPEQ